MSKKILLTVKDAALMCSVSESTVRRWIDCGDIEIFRDSRIVRIPVHALEEFTGCPISEKLPSLLSE